MARGNFPVLKRAFFSTYCRFHSLLTFKEPKLIWPSACAFYSLTVTTPIFVSARSLIERTIFMARVLSHAVQSTCLPFCFSLWCMCDGYLCCLQDALFCLFYVHAGCWSALLFCINWLANRATLLHVNTGYRLYCFSFGLTLKNRGKLVPLYMYRSFVFIASFVSAVKNIRKSRTNCS